MFASCPNFLWVKKLADEFKWFQQVFEKLGPSLYDFLRRNSYRSFPIDLVRELGRQLLESVACVWTILAPFSSISYLLDAQALLTMKLRFDHQYFIWIPLFESYSSFCLNKCELLISNDNSLSFSFILSFLYVCSYAWLTSYTHRLEARKYSSCFLWIC